MDTRLYFNILGEISLMLTLVRSTREAQVESQVQSALTLVRFSQSAAIQC